MIQTATFALESPKKHSVKYAETPTDQQPVIIGALYVKRSALPAIPPKRIRVTVEVLDA